MFIKNRIGTDLIEKVVFILAVAIIAVVVFTQFGKSSQIGANAVSNNVSPNRIPVFPE